MNSSKSEDIDISIIEHPSALSMSDLFEEYQKLCECVNRQKKCIELHKQAIHDLKRDKELKERILTEELQAISENYDSELSSYKKKYLNECEHLKKRLSESNTNIQKLAQENEWLKNELDVAVSQPLKSLSEINVFDKNDSKANITCSEEVEKNHLEISEKMIHLESEKALLMSHVKVLEVRLNVFPNLLYVFFIKRLISTTLLH